MAGIGRQTGKTREPTPPTTAAPTRSQVNRENKAPAAGPAAKPPPKAAKPPPVAAPQAPQPAQTSGGESSPYGRRRGDGPEIPAKSPAGSPSSKEGECGDASGPEAQPPRKPQHSWHISAVAAQILLALICVTTESAFNERSDESDANISLQTQPQPRTGPQPQVLSAPSAQNVVGLTAEEALTTALDDLNSALETQPDRSPEELLEQVSTSDHKCMLAWHDHVPSLVFGKEPVETDSLANTLHACADAVRRLH